MVRLGSRQANPEVQSLDDVHCGGTGAPCPKKDEPGQTAELHVTTCSN
jgi:hypothetical protein